MKIINYPLPKSQYYPIRHTKRQIVIHHTVSNGSAKNVIDWWRSNPAKIGASYVIDRDGNIYQAFPEKYWAHHLGVKNKSNLELNQKSIAIELCNWGGLKSKNNQYFSTFQTKVDPKEVIDYGQNFRGFQYFQKYTQQQINSLRELLQNLCAQYNIPKKFLEIKWDVSPRALKGIPGIYTHCHFRSDKSDCHPQSELIEMLLSINKEPFIKS